MNDRSNPSQFASTPPPRRDQGQQRAAAPVLVVADDRRRVRDRQRELVRASLIARPPGASSTHHRWA